MTHTFKKSRNGFKLLHAVIRWFDTEAVAQQAPPEDDGKQVDWVRVLPLIVLHLACLAVFWVGWSPTAVAVAVGLYVVRMFAITGFYHRYFSHRTFQTNRFWQFVFAILGNSAVQRGPLWWAAHHRHHHRHADQPEDVHSPKQHGFWWGHIGWLTSRANFGTRHRYVKDWMRFPELRWLNRFDIVVPTLLALALFAAGRLLAVYAPALETDAWQLVVWGFCVSSVVLLHGTCTINSVVHLFGRRRYNTPDTSRNNALAALITLGEGWHNNHHHYAVCTRQGFYWWEIDITYILLRIMAGLGIVRNLRGLPETVKNARP